MAKNDKKVLVIEDELSLSRAVSEALGIENFNVKSAVNAESGMQNVHEFKPDLILLDLILPGKNGFEFLKDLRAQPEYAKTPVIVMSNLGDEVEIKQAMELGAVDFLIKVDNDLNQITKIVKKYVRK